MSSLVRIKKSKEKTPLELEFEQLLLDSLNTSSLIEGNVVKGRVISIINNQALIDIGAKSEGRIDLSKMTMNANISAGDTIDVYLEKVDNSLGESILSIEKAKKEKAWSILKANFDKGEKITGIVLGRVKGGFTVDPSLPDTSGISAFLPASQIDLRQLKEGEDIVGMNLELLVLKMDRKKGNIVVSRKAVVQDQQDEQKGKILQTLKEGDIKEGVVKNITDYGAFIDLGFVDGLLHLTDMSWKRINHPTELLTVGQTVKVGIIKVDHEHKRISLGMKHLQSDPWNNLINNYQVGSVVTGKITNIADYGAFVELESGIEGLIHITEMSWTKRNVHPSKIVSVGSQVSVAILEIDQEKRRISLGLKQTTANPWDDFSVKHPLGSEVEVTVKNITNFGVFVSLPNDIDGLIHFPDLASSEAEVQAKKQNLKKGDALKAYILSIDVEKGRVSLTLKTGGKGSKSTDDSSDSEVKYNVGQVVTAVVTETEDSGVHVVFNDDAKGFIKKFDLSSEKNEQKSDRFAVGNKIDAIITASPDKKNKVYGLSIKALQIAEEKEAIAKYGSSDSGASLGEILGAYLKTDEK